MDLDNSTIIQIDEALPVVKLCKRVRDPTAFGVVGGVDKDGRFRIGNMAFRKDMDVGRIIVQSQGEGAIWVTNAGGPIRNGDYVTTSHIPGYATRQGSQLHYNYTVAKVTCDCVFTKSFTYRGKKYKKAFVGCVYCF